MRRLLLVSSFLGLILPLSLASAHYLWVTIDQKHGEHGAANIYFEGGPSAGDGRYLDHFTNTKKTWVRTMKSTEPRLIDSADVRDGDKRWLQAELDAVGPRSVDCYAKFGVYNYGKTRVLLHYYGRNLDVTNDAQVEKLSRAEQMNLEIAPRTEGKKVTLTVYWKGEPAAKRMVYVRGPKGFKENPQTDEKGQVQFDVVDAGRFTIRTSVEEKTPGKDGDDEYDLIRHQGTLIMTLPKE